MLTIRYEASFKRDYKRIKRRGYDLCLIEEVIDLLIQQKPLPERYKDHGFIGDYAGCRECHITPDWLLVYQISQDKLILILTRTGTHSDLF